MSLNSDCLLSITGVFPDEVTPREHMAAQAVPDTWARRLRAWVGADEGGEFKYVEPKNMDRLFDRLAMPPTMDEVAGWLEGAGHDDPELQADYFVGLTRARNLVVQAWPKITIDSAAGPKLLPLSEDDAEEVWSLFMVADDPDRILDEMDSLTLTQTQAALFREAYPDLYAFADQAVAMAMAGKLAKDPAFDIGWEREGVLRTLRGKPPEAELTPPPEPPKPEGKFDAGEVADREKTQAQVSGGVKGKK